MYLICIHGGDSARVYSVDSVVIARRKRALSLSHSLSLSFIHVHVHVRMHACIYPTKRTNERTNERERFSLAKLRRETIGVSDTFDRGVRDATNVANISASQRDYELLTRAGRHCYWPERHASTPREPGQYDISIDGRADRERQWPREHRWVVAGI